MDGSSIPDLAKVQQLAEEYASYSLSKGGLANVLGGIAGIVIYLLNGLLGRGLLTTMLTLALTVSWLIGKQWLRALLYRPFGEAREQWSEGQRHCQRRFAGFFSLVTLVCWFMFWYGYLLGRISLIQLILGLIVATSIPWIAWRWLTNFDEQMVGGFLLVSCALVCVGSLLGEGPTAWEVAGWMPLYAVMLVWRGIREHWRFLNLSRQLQAQGAVH